MDPSHKLRLNVQTLGGVHKYPAKQHAQRVAAKLKVSKALILLQGEKTDYYSNSDNPRPFRQDRYFYYLTGCNEAGCYVTYDTDKDKLILWIPHVQFSYYDGRGSTIEEAMELYDVDEAIYITGKRRQSNLSSFIKDHYESGGHCLFLRNKTDVIQKPLRMQMLKDRNTPGWKVRTALDSCRAVKDDYEIELVRKANAITAEAHTNVMKQLHRLKSEPEVEGLYIGTCISAKARQQSYTPICGSGSNASQLHYVDNDQDFRDRQVLLIDAGAEWQDYASDVTRTMPINPKNPGHWKSEEAEAVYNHVARIQESCIEWLKPGRHFIDVHWHSVHMSIDALLDLGILKGEHKDIFHAGVALAFYPHGLGHHIGLEVHDVPPPMKWNKEKMQQKDRRFRNLRQVYQRFASSHPHPEYTAKIFASEPEHFGLDPSHCYSPTTPTDPPLEAGMVVTIEPGLYFNKTILDDLMQNDEFNKFVDKHVLEKYMHVGGVRIEDDILITKDGYENLTTAPKGQRMLEVIRDGAKGS